MKTLTIIFIIFIGISGITFTQDDVKPIKWVIRPSVGSNLPITKLSSGYITDNLFGFTNNSYYWQFISTSYFFNNWGIEFTMSGNHNSVLDDRYGRFISDVNKKYNEKYFVHAGSGAQYSDFNIVGGSIEKGSFGPVYKFESNKNIFIGRFLLAVISFSTDWGDATLKSKGTNDIIYVRWETNSVNNDFWGLSPSFTYGYRLFDKIFIVLDINYRVYKINFNYLETSNNLNSEEKITKVYAYSNWINELSFGLGFMFVIK